jgi:ASC-1-like (ASCH) protein
MTTTATILDHIESAARSRPAISEALADARKIHVAVMVQPYIDYILDGTKTIESRFTKTRQPPYGMVQPSDIILFKESSGPIRGCALVRTTNYFVLDNTPIDDLMTEYGTQIAALPAFWRQKADARYATLLGLARVRSCDPFDIPKRDPRSWLVIDCEATEGDESRKALTATDGCEPP